MIGTSMLDKANPGLTVTLSGSFSEVRARLQYMMPTLRLVKFEPARAAGPLE